jgi:hypothetical protein
MCISIQIKFKTAVVMLVFGGLIIGTWIGHRDIENNIDKIANMETVSCEIMSSKVVKANDETMWHNNWRYTFDNEKYFFTNETTSKAATHKCCLMIDDPCIIINCVSDIGFLYAAYIIAGWFVGLVILCILWVFRDKPQLQSNAATRV